MYWGYIHIQINLKRTTLKNSQVRVHDQKEHGIKKHRNQETLPVALDQNYHFKLRDHKNLSQDITEILRDRGYTEKEQDWFRSNVREFYLEEQDKNISGSSWMQTARSAIVREENKGEAEQFWVENVRDQSEGQLTQRQRA